MVYLVPWGDRGGFHWNLRPLLYRGRDVSPWTAPRKNTVRCQWSGYGTWKPCDDIFRLPRILNVEGIEGYWPVLIILLFNTTNNSPVSEYCIICNSSIRTILKSNSLESPKIPGTNSCLDLAIQHKSTASTFEDAEPPQDDQLYHV